MCYGVTGRLRGAAESRACLYNDFFMVTTCHACQLDLCCIADAHFVLCPACHVVSPIEQLISADDRDNNTAIIGNGGGGGGGVGLGFTVDELRQLQCEIVTQRQIIETDVVLS